MATQLSQNKCGNTNCTTYPTSTRLRTCSRCKETAYCSNDCQKAHWSTHKSHCRRQNYIITFHLAPIEITNPPVLRTLSCPAETTFYNLHWALQTSFNWSVTHSFDFAVANPDYAPPQDILGVIMQLRDIEFNSGQNPATAARLYLIRVVDPVNNTVDRAHEGSRKHPNTPEKKANEYKLYQLFDNPRYRDRDIIYTYDFGDNWEHHISIIGRAPFSPGYKCLDGIGHGVAEDVGGYRGWEELKAAYRVSRPNEEQQERRAWFEKYATNKDPEGLRDGLFNEFDIARVNADLALLTRMFDQKADDFIEPGKLELLAELARAMHIV
ncbi:plasmid pRiA4b ORF-3-like protein-domain-containing protein [Xylariomycetidae sp. FL2044]|nr:plasmid pRiA4b ORF-3-like protein-domain-containing protein [Xylariomycetidae sp. FL2044]